MMMILAERVEEQSGWGVRSVLEKALAELSGLHCGNPSG